jgi:ethanolamine ammonia-lyase large subunit
MLRLRCKSSEMSLTNGISLNNLKATSMVNYELDQIQKQIEAEREIHKAEAQRQLRLQEERHLIVEETQKHSRTISFRRQIHSESVPNLGGFL